MSVKKQKDGRYKLEIYPDGREGKRVRKLFETKAEAIRYERHILDSANNDPWNPKIVIDNRSMSEIGKRYEDLHLKATGDWLNKSRCLYRVIRTLGDPVAIQIDKKTMSEYITSRRSSGIKPKTVNNEITIIKSMYNKLRELDEIAYDNPLSGIRKLKLDESDKTYLELVDLKRLMEALKDENSDCYLTAKMCASTGARWGEAQRMESGRVKAGSVYYNKTKTARNRTIGISEEFYKELPKVKGRLFADTYGTFLKVFHSIGLDIPKGQASHVLRHTFATHYMKNGGNILDLKVLLGHSKIEMTMVYAHHSPSYMNHAVTLNPISNIK